MKYANNKYAYSHERAAKATRIRGTEDLEQGKQWRGELTICNCYFSESICPF